MKTINKNTDPKRRIFLKKAAYHAPCLIIMGALAKPTNAEAGGGRNSNPGGPPTGTGRARRP